MNSKSTNTKRLRPNGVEHTRPLPITAEEFDRKAEAGEDINDYLEWDKIEMLEPEPPALNVDFPTSLLVSLEKEANRIGVTPDALVKIWVAERLDALTTKAA